MYGICYFCKDFIVILIIWKSNNNGLYIVIEDKKVLKLLNCVKWFCFLNIL